MRRTQKDYEYFNNKCYHMFHTDQIACDPGTQFTLPWALPHCLDYIPYDKVSNYCQAKVFRIYSIFLYLIITLD